uniref:Uncharacterized protein n=1 Tax=Arundo donax TaxID=35708 RepID=A0A0A9AWD9_ARUDO
MHRHVVTNFTTSSVYVYVHVHVLVTVVVLIIKKKVSYCTLNSLFNIHTKADCPSDFLFETCMYFIQKWWHQGKGEKKTKLISW